MPLQLILGPAAGGKTFTLEQEVVSAAAENPQQPLIYIVPEQTTLKVQQRLLQALPGHAMLGIEILSFNRLAHRILTETGMPDITLLDDMGKSMVLYKIAREHKSELIYYGGSTEKKGFIGQLKLMVTELFQYGLNEERLQQLIQAQADGSILKAKLTDIALLWHYFKEYTNENLIASEAVLELLAERVQQSQLIRQAFIYVDDFSGFTPQQYRVLTGLALRSRKLSIALTLTPAAYKAVQAVRDWRDLPRQTFFPTAKTTWKLLELCRAYGIGHSLVWKQGGHAPEELLHATWQLQQLQPVAYQGKAERVRGFRAQGQSQELQQVFHEIMRLVQEEGYAYRDIAVVLTDLPSYAYPIRRQLSLYQIPGFIDEKTDISLNPYVQWLQGVGDWASTGFSDEGLFSILKTGLSELEPAALDKLENTALKENWQGIRRIAEGLRFQEQMAAQPGEQADLWQGPLSRLAESLERFAENTKGRRSVSELTQAYQTLADELQVQKRLQEKKAQLEADGKLQLAMQYGRIFEVAGALQQRLNEVMGTAAMTIKEYAEILEIGLAQSKMGQLPPSLDELFIADLNRSKLTAYRAVFIVGLQEGSFPKAGGAKSLLTQAERTRAGEMFELAQGEKENLAEQFFLLYTAMGKAQERLYLFSSQAGADGKAYGAGVIGKRIEKTLGEGWQLPEPGLARRTQPFLYENHELLAGTAGKWLEAYGFSEQIAKMHRAKKLRFEEKELSPAMARRLMDPAQRQLSVTQLERYARCPFSYFLRYGLQLKERELPQVRSLEDGNVLHDVLQEARQFLAKALGKEEAAQIAEQITQKKQEEYPVYQTSGRYRYYWQKLQRVAARALQVLAGQVAQGEFQPAAFEWRFGGGEMGGTPIEVEIGEGRHVQLQGKIDRIDLWEQGEERYVRIIDYKSGQTTVDAPQMYAGLQLQLPVYLQAGAQNYDAKPAGMFYFHLTPVVKEAKDGEADNEMKQALLAGRLDGLVLDDEAVVQGMDGTLMAGADSLVLKTRINKKDGRLKRSDQLASAEQLKQLEGFTRQKIRELAQKLAGGCVSQDPVEWSNGSGSSCQLCEYRKACPFDERVPGSEKRRLEKMSMTEFWEKTLDVAEIEEEKETEREL